MKKSGRGFLFKMFVVAGAATAIAACFPFLHDKPAVEDKRLTEEIKKDVHKYVDDVHTLTIDQLPPPRGE